MNKRVHKPEPGESGEQETHQPTSLVGHLMRELSGTAIGTDESARPVCKRCHDLGASSEELYIDTGEPVYVCFYWEEQSGWRALGVYHVAHTEAIGPLLENPRKPAVVFEAEYEDRSGDDADVSGFGTYGLTNFSYVDMALPESMAAPNEVSV